MAKERARVFIYALSTCGWCRKTKALLDELGVSYEQLDVDMLPPEEREKAKAELMKWNAACSFPTVIADHQECIVGYREDALRRLAE